MAIKNGRNIALALKIKYGLPNDPSDSIIAAWKIHANQLIAEGKGTEEAGRTSASEVFVGFNTHVYASEADDISSLLDAASDR